MFRFSVKRRGRLSTRATSVQHVAYMLRTQEGPAQAHVAYMLRASTTTEHREDLIMSGSGNLPTWAQGDALTFWAAAEHYERANGRTATTWEITLPREFTRRDQRAVVADFLTTQFGTQHPYTWALHEARASDGKLNPHIHVAFSARTLDGIDRPPAQFFARYNAQDPTQGGAQKNPHLTQRGIVARQRAAWADVANWHLEQRGYTERLDPQSYVRRGIEREALARIPVQEFSQAKYHGIVSDPLRDRRAGQALRAQLWAGENRLAVEAWTQRKRALGIIVHPRTKEGFLAEVTARTYTPRLDMPYACTTVEQHLADAERLVAALQRQQTQDKVMTLPQRLAVEAALLDDAPPLRHGLHMTLDLERTSYGR
jgi:hypothetical protein